MLRITIEELDENTKEVTKTLMSEENDGTYRGVCCLGMRDESIQVFMHRTSVPEIASAIVGSPELRKAATCAVFISNLGLPDIAKAGEENAQ